MQERKLLLGRRTMFEGARAALIGRGGARLPG